MRLPAILAFTIIFAACSGADTGMPNLLSLSTTSGPQPQRDAAHYTALKESIRQDQAHFSRTYHHKSHDSNLNAARQYLYHYICDSIFAYWYGTPWDFNGTTEVPGQGKIACGYFVTTVLRDAGLPISRIKLAQAPASRLINTVCNQATVRRFSTVAQLEQYLGGRPVPSLLALGLDNHVGFIIHDATGNYFVHSSCVGAKAVERQLLRAAEPINASKSFMIGDILSNTALLNKWINCRR